MDILLNKTLSVPSFGHYWKQPIGRAYSVTSVPSTVSKLDLSFACISACFQDDIEFQFNIIDRNGPLKSWNACVKYMVQKKRKNYKKSNILVNKLM